MNRLLSIGIPTYNRSCCLDVMLQALTASVSPFADQIEVILSDNCSGDATPDIIANWLMRQPAALAARHVRHPENIGVSRNLVSLLYAACGDYFMFLGDDDQLNPDTFGRLLHLLAEKRPVAVIQALWAGRIRGAGTGELRFDEALSLFYEYGNAWAGVVDREAAVRAVNNRGIRGEIEAIVWPQTVFGFLAMHDAQGRHPIEAVDFEIGRPLAESLNITTKAYWLRSLTGLLMAAVLVQHHTSSRAIRSRLLAGHSHGVTGHVRAIFWHALVDEDRTSLTELRQLLRQAFGWRGWAWAALLWLDARPRALRRVAELGYRLSRLGRSASLKARIDAARRQRDLDIENRSTTGKRFGDWF
ncbi:glycosyltransferase family 2 protein [Chitinolyticbacter meiyuanensis]|uniref:glycosyltransferase family 2 protein n=1 Tax=Chitinolyticbacter meiyuanensis TaxID=682798 RepID=UPI0011E5B1A6|nr:glycosyltransferase family 2 protein [Chitinolyticbacter meiyuanensis]